TLEVKADVFDSDGTNNLDANDTIQVELRGGDINNAFGQISGATLDVLASDPTANSASTAAGNTLTVSTGGLTLSKYTAYPNTTFVAPQTKAKIAHFTLSANTTETVNLNTISIDLDGKADAFDASDDLANLYVVYGEKTTTVKSTVADTSNSWSIDYAMTPGKTIDLVVYADIASSSTNGDATADTIRADVTITGTSAVSGAAANATEQQGQTITSGSGSFTAAVDGGTPLTYVVSGSTATDIAAGAPKTITAATFKFTAVNDAFSINEVKVKVGSDVSGALLNAVLKDGSTVLGTKPFDLTSQTTAHFTGLNVAVPANTTKVLTVELQLNQPFCRQQHDQQGRENHA
ncbi:MAG: hypothetical protein HYS76_01825, partial [Candidatus Wildermuthbacteria bacterium]|nr:hypothetical protein [Candidatus Wildermuthbacteria bacterium]